jgi:hypothetical protein
MATMTIEYKCVPADDNRKFMDHLWDGGIGMRPRRCDRCGEVEKIPQDQEGASDG